MMHILFIITSVVCWFAIVLSLPVDPWLVLPVVLIGAIVGFGMHRIEQLFFGRRPR